jgi:hypothetical protein
MTTDAHEQNKIWFMVKLSLGLMLLSLLFPVFQQSVHATSNGQKIQFNPDIYSVQENVKSGYVYLQIERTGGDYNSVVSVTYCTCDGTAVASEDYTHTPGTLIFYKKEHEKTIKVEIVNDNIKESDQQFYVKLITIKGDAVLGDNKLATVIIHDGNDETISSPPPTSVPTNLSKSEPSLLSVVVATPAPEVAVSPAPEVTVSPMPTDKPQSPTPTPTPKVVLDDSVQPQQASVNQSSDSNMPNTATPWYNYIVVGSLLVLLSGTMLYRRIAAFRRE